jgi:hypothetical protein
MQLIKSTPAMPVTDIAIAVEFYVTNFGFLDIFHDEGYGIVGLDGVEIHLWKASDESWRDRQGQPIISGAESFLAGTHSCRIEVKGIDEIFETCRKSGVLHPVQEFVDAKPWGTREFPALDLHHNLITFYERRNEEVAD